MEHIDIITFTDTQFSLLTKGQLQTVKTTQQRKNRLYRDLQERLRREKHKLVKNGMYRSEIYSKLETRLTAEYENEVELMKQCLLFYLHYSMKPNETISTSAPYEVNYALSAEARLLIVKNYYEETYANADELFAVFLTDTVAPQYLGELYAPLYDHFLAKSKNN